MGGWTCRTFKWQVSVEVQPENEKCMGPERATRLMPLHAAHQRAPQILAADQIETTRESPENLVDALADAGPALARRL